MIEIDLQGVVARAVGNLLSLYMLLILVRWLAPWMQLDLHTKRLRWICVATDPLLDAMRRLLPPMGPMDFGPLAALFAVWVVRTLSVSILA
ncbi:MAG: hypothetical protein GWP08_03315 [Nitrospiraceae bacterium]|nr:hypothetical protein [Nitrospiraceae bacterium]